MKAFINRVMNSAKNYTLWDFTMLKLGLIFLGILFGAYFAEFFLANILIVWCIFAICYLGILLRTFGKKNA